MIKQRCTKPHITNGIKKSVYGKEFLSKTQWTEWCYEEGNYRKFVAIYNKWVQSKFDRRLTPSIDRINNEIGYKVSNLQWLTSSQNSSKSNK